jgi:polyferredoxin
MAAGRIIPIRALAAAPEASRQRLRRWSQAAFFAFFVLAPVFDVLRYDLPAGHAWLLGFEWHAGLDDLLCVSKVAALGAIGRIFGRVILPVFALGGLLMWAAWRWGRLYCGWLCPHFWVVELINECMRRAGGRPTLWEPRPLPLQRADGRPIVPDRRWWLAAALLAVGCALVWAVVTLT